MTAIWPDYANQAAALDALITERRDYLVAAFPDQASEIDANYANRPVAGSGGDPARVALVIYAAQQSVPSQFAIDSLLLESADASHPFA